MRFDQLSDTAKHFAILDYISGYNELKTDPNDHLSYDDGYSALSDDLIDEATYNAKGESCYD
jgi:hypothetical protein